MQFLITIILQFFLLVASSAYIDDKKYGMGVFYFGIFLMLFINIYFLKI